MKSRQANIVAPFFEIIEQLAFEKSAKKLEAIHEASESLILNNVEGRHSSIIKAVIK